MNGKHLVAALLISIGAFGATARGAEKPAKKPAEKATQPAATKPAKPTPPKPPEVLKDAVDPLNLVKERERFFVAAGPDNELSKDELAASRGKPNAFVRKFDTFEEMLAFDKNANKTIDWFEARAYREGIRQRVLAAFDANKDKKLTGDERDKANRALASGRIPGGGRASGRTGLWVLSPEDRKTYDVDGDGQLSREERRALWRERQAARQKEMLAKYDANKNGQLDEDERKALREEIRSGLMLRLFDRNGDGKLDEAESAAAKEAQARWDQRVAEWGETRDQMLKKYDADGNGRLEGEERTAAWRDLRQQWSEKRFDANGDGKLDEKEQAAMKEAEAEARATYDGWRREWVKRYDKDGDGRLSEEERQVGYDDLAKDVRAMREQWMAKWDADGDGQMSEQERQVMRDSVRQRAAELRKEMDADGDGRVTGQEMRAFWEKLKEMYDTDEDGLLSTEETRAMIQDQIKRVRPVAPARGP